jgi:serine/threonine protein kinase
MWGRWQHCSPPGGSLLAVGVVTFGWCAWAVRQVRLARRADGLFFAIKCLNRSRIAHASQSGRLAKEIRLLRMLNHPNVIRLYEVLHTPSEILMVMEYVDGGDLLEVLNTRPRFAEAEVRHIFNQICSGVSFCHSLGVAHRDLKPENVLIGKKVADGSYLIKVADFGLSTLMRTDEMLSTACGSPHYVAPEILTFDGGAAYDGLLSDVWSLGVMLHVMLLYKLPFEADSTQLLYKKIRQGLPSLPEALSPAAASLLQGMLTVDPTKRMTLVQVAQQEWPQLQATAPLVVSQTVDAAVDYPGLGSYGGGSLKRGSESILSASNLFKLGSDPSSSDEASHSHHTQLRRAFTFDALPAANDDSCETLLFAPRAVRPTPGLHSPPLTPLIPSPYYSSSPHYAGSSPREAPPPLRLSPRSLHGAATRPVSAARERLTDSSSRRSSFGRIHIEHRESGFSSADDEGSAEAAGAEGAAAAAAAAAAAEGSADVSEAQLATGGLISTQLATGGVPLIVTIAEDGAEGGGADAEGGGAEGGDGAREDDALAGKEGQCVSVEARTAAAEEEQMTVEVA